MSTSSSGIRGFEIEGKLIGHDRPTYFIADIAANHDGSLQQAVDLIYLAAEAGADAAKFQHFKAETIVSDFGFNHLSSNVISHQSKWKASVTDVYRAASVNLEWTETLQAASAEAGISFFSTPYSLELADELDPHVPAYKIGSGDITWIELIKHVARKNKPWILATGAASLDDVERAVSAGRQINPDLCLMQCNTNYTGSLENFKYLNLNVLNTYRGMYPSLLLGLSDHTPGHSSVLGAVTLGARMIEKHFTDDTNREGPDHAFSMDPKSWREMVDRTRELELALGTGLKKIEENEQSTSVVQRRSLRLSRDLPAGHVLTSGDLIPLRPCPVGAIAPYEIDHLLGRSLRVNVQLGEHISWSLVD